jgi:hypothetical protein
LTTVLDVKIKDFPTHAASLPVGLIPNCAATRHIHFTLDGSGPADIQPAGPFRVAGDCMERPRPLRAASTWTR